MAGALTLVRVRRFRYTERVRFFHLISPLFLGLLCGCPSSEAVKQAPTPPPAPSAVPLTGEDRLRLEAWGETLQAALAEEDAATLDRAWNLDRLWSRIVAGLDLPLELNDSARAAFAEQQRAPGSAPLSDLLGAEVSFRGLRDDPEQGARLVFRGFLAGGAVSYVELHVADPRATPLQFEDAYVYANGELLSQTLRRLVEPGLRASAGLPETSEQATSNAALEALELLRSDNPAAALDVLETLPPAERAQRSVLILRRNAISELFYAPGGKAHKARYLAILAELEDGLGDDPRAQLLLADARLLREDHEAYLAGLDALGEVVGKDGYLQFMRATAYSREGEHEAAVEACRAGLKLEPTLDRVRFGLIEVYLAGQYYPELAELFTELESLGYELDFAEIEGLEPFYASKAGRAFVQGRSPDEPTIR